MLPSSQETRECLCPECDRQKVNPAHAFHSLGDSANALLGCICFCFHRFLSLFSEPFPATRNYGRKLKAHVLPTTGFGIAILCHACRNSPDGSAGKRESSGKGKSFTINFHKLNRSWSHRGKMCDRSGQFTRCPEACNDGGGDLQRKRMCPGSVGLSSRGCGVVFFFSRVQT